jgi:hypothetical protein
VPNDERGAQSDADHGRNQDGHDVASVDGRRASGVPTRSPRAARAGVERGVGDLDESV